MLSISVRNSHLIVNEKSIVNLKKPFKRMINHPEGVDKMLRTPSQTLKRPGNPLPYLVKITNSKAGALFNIDQHGLKSHWLYPTNPSISDLFKDKTLQTVLHNLDSDQNNFETIRQYISITIDFLFMSYNFDLIYTNIPTLSSITKETVLMDQSMLVKLPHMKYVSRRYNSVKALLNGHPGGLPLRLFNWEVYTRINSRHTTLDKEIFKGYNNILIITGTNNQYAGFLFREIKKISGVKEVLPTCLFKI